MDRATVLDAFRYGQRVRFRAYGMNDWFPCSGATGGGETGLTVEILIDGETLSIPFRPLDQIEIESPRFVTPSGCDHTYCDGCRCACHFSLSRGD